MSAPEFARLRPIPGNVVLAKALLFTDPKAREMAFFLQAMSMQDGGIRTVAVQLVAWFPDRCREESSQKAYALRLAHSLKDSFDDEPCRAPDRGDSLISRTVELLSDFLTDLAINPRLSLTQIECGCFADLAGALFRFKQLHEGAVWNGYVMTASGRLIMETLDQALRLKRMVVVEGPAGAGKSFNGKSWCQARPGSARLIGLTGITNRTIFFQKIGQSIGLATCQRKAQELQSKIEDFFIRSGMMLVVDEAHFLWPQGDRRTGPPELIDWIDTALVNHGVPVALLCTDQFSKLKNRVERGTGWSSEQFTRRVFRFKKLELPTMDDVVAVTRSLLSAVWDEAKNRWLSTQNVCSAVAVEALARWATEGQTPYSCVAACIDEARDIARTAGRIVVTRDDLTKALSQGQIPSDMALKAAFAPTPAERRPRSLQAPPTAARRPNKAFVSSQATAIGASRSIQPCETTDFQNRQISTIHRPDHAEVITS
jgi:hypothetical protein